jgi:putative ABC transport system permease protein
VNLALRDIRHTKLRFGLTVCGVALLLTAANGMGGLYRGIVRDVLRQLDLLQADLWVVQGGTAGPFAEPSKVPFTVRDRALGVQGVAAARAYFETSIVVDEANVTVIGLDWPTDRGAWIPLSSGRFLGTGRGEAIADRSLGLEVGEELRMGRERFTVVGLADRFLSSMGDGMIALSLTDAVIVQSERPAAELRMSREQIIPASAGGTAAMASAVLINLEPGAAADAVARTIERWGDVSVVPDAAQQAYLIEGRLGRLRAQILTFTVLLLLITAVVITLIVYTLTMEKLHEIAMLKLLGSRNRVILGMIVQQAIAIGVAAYLAAQALGAVIFPLFPRDVVLLPADRALYAVLLLLICFIASGLGIHRALKVEAQEVLA